jgi:glutathione S-transferase
METALDGRAWLVGEAFSMADIAMAPYLNRLSALAMEGMWTGGRLPNVEAWFDRIRRRPAFHPGFIEWMPIDLTEEMRANGRQSWPDVKALLAL